MRVRGGLADPRARIAQAIALVLAALNPAYAWAQEGKLARADRAAAYEPIVPAAAGRIVTLTGRDLTPEQLVAVARYGARVELAPSARLRAEATYGLLLEGAAEGVPIYLFNRGGGLNREIIVFSGDPLAADNQARITQMQLRSFQNGPRAGVGPEMVDEGAVRAMMAVRANTLADDGPSPQLLQSLIDLLNHRITPVVQSAYGTVGEADIALMQNVAGAMVGRGEVYAAGVRMSAASALTRAGLKPIAPFGADSTALTSTNAYTTSQAGLLVVDARAMLEWADLAYAVDLLGMNSSVTPLSWPVQAARPQRWLNWHAAKTLKVLRGAYLFEQNPKRIIQDPDSLRASSIRQASAWQVWSALREAATFQMNSSDHNPTIRVGPAPAEAWELATPMLKQYAVKGGAYSHGTSGYVVSNANWDPYPLANAVEAFTLALGNMDVAVAQRVFRFADPFHTGVKAADVLGPDRLAAAAPQGNGTTIVALEQALETQLSPVTPTGLASDVHGNGDVESGAPRKVAKARMAVRLSEQLLAQDLLTGTYWMDVRRVESPGRAFGTAPTAVWTALREVVPWQAPPGSRPDRPAADFVDGFMTSHPASGFYAGGSPPPP